MPALLLASASPRRQELLRQLNIPFSCFSPDIDESKQADETIVAYAKRMAIEKVKTAYQFHQNQLILAADTCGEIIDENGQCKLLSKPIDFDDGQRLLKLLSNRQHFIHSAFALFDGQWLHVEVVTSSVTMGEISDVAIARYWATGEPCGKAGAYAIQGQGAQFVKHLEGSYSAVMGLPLYELSQALATYHIDLL